MLYMHLSYGNRIQLNMVVIVVDKLKEIN